MGTVITVTSGKGGTGKTTVTGGVASCLARLGKNVLCIDMDIGPSEPGYFAGTQRPGADGLCRRGPGELSPGPGRRVPPDLPNLSLLTAPMRLPAPSDGGQHSGAAAHGPGPVRLHFHRLPPPDWGPAFSWPHAAPTGRWWWPPTTPPPCGTPSGPWRSCTACVRSIW